MDLYCSQSVLSFSFNVHFTFIYWQGLLEENIFGGKKEKQPYSLHKNGAKKKTKEFERANCWNNIKIRCDLIDSTVMRACVRFILYKKVRSRINATKTTRMTDYFRLGSICFQITGTLLHVYKLCLDLIRFLVVTCLEQP